MCQTDDEVELKVHRQYVQSEVPVADCNRGDPVLAIDAKPVKAGVMSAVQDVAW